MHVRKITAMCIFSFIMLAGMAMLLLACGPSDGGQQAQEGDGVEPMVETKTPSGGVASPTATITPTGTVTPPLNVPPSPYHGPKSLEERIFESSVIARVRLDSMSSSAESGTTRFGTKYIAVLEFNLSVEEYLKGSGADDIVAVWNSVPVFDTLQEAEDALPAIAAGRDAQWDDREAIVFLQNSRAYLPSTQEAGRFFLSGKTNFDDNYSIASRHRTLWLPAVATAGDSSQPTGDQQRFLTDVPPAEGTVATITLGEIKTRIAGVTTKLAAGDGTEEYTECVRETYYLERKHRYLREIYPDRVNTGSNISPPHTHQFNSGLAADSVVYEVPDGDTITPSVPFEVWLDGGDASLFSVASPSQDYRVTTTRPLPSREYDFHFNHRGPYFGSCDGSTTRYEWTITVNAAAGTLHEAFFDPVTVGTAVKADGSNGVLKPTSFTLGGTPTEIVSLRWDDGKVVLTLNPYVALGGYVLMFIALDGSVSLSLSVDDAVVDDGAGEYSWAVSSKAVGGWGYVDAAD